jgi:hypothetical protein
MTKPNSDNIRKQIKESRPNLSDSSINTYISSLYHLYKKSGDTSDFNSLKFLFDFDEITKLLKDMPDTTKKTRLTAIVVALKSLPKKESTDKLIEKYMALMEKVAEEYNNFIKTQAKTKKQKDNWAEVQDIDKVTNRLFNSIQERELRTKTELSKKDYALLQEYVVLRLYSSYYVRNDLATTLYLSQKEYDKLKDKTKENYIVKDGSKYTIYLNKYKNSKFLGSREYDVDKKLAKILNIWFKFNKSKFLLTKTDRERMLGSNSLTKLLTKLFERELGKKISTSMLRHIRATEENKDETTILEDEAKEKEIENKYLHSASMNKRYSKIK